MVAETPLLSGLAGLASVAAFPRAAIATCIRDELIETVKAEASIKGVDLPASLTQIAQTAFQIDSLVMVSILCAVEPIIGFELPESVVRSGGYSSVEYALEQVLPRIEALWIKRNGGKS